MVTVLSIGKKSCRCLKNRMGVGRRPCATLAPWMPIAMVTLWKKNSLRFGLNSVSLSVKLKSSLSCRLSRIDSSLKLMWMICHQRRHLRSTWACFQKDFQLVSRAKSPSNSPNNLKQPCSKRAKKTLKHLLRNKESLMRQNDRNLRLSSRKLRNSLRTKDKNWQPKRRKASPTWSVKTRRRSNRCMLSLKGCYKTITASRTKTTRKSSRLSTTRACSRMSTLSDALTYSWTLKTMKVSPSSLPTHSPLGNQRTHTELIKTDRDTYGRELVGR